MKRAFDILASFVVLAILSPLLILIGIIVALESPGGPFYRQERIGRYGIPFRMFKFRSMRIGSDKKGLLTVGADDNRITRSGRFIRKYKLDEFPQLLNVIMGDMSIVGPRPEVKKYVDLYSEEQRKVLEVRPGLTDYASLAYFDENELLAKADDPEKVYIDEVMPEKLKLNLRYIEDQGMGTDLAIIFGTIKKIVS